MKILISILLILHGLIVAGQSAGSFGSALPNEIQNPAFVSWWPVNMGRSWLFSWLGLEKTLSVYRVGGLLWLVSGIILVAAGLSILGWIIPSAWWRDLAVAGGANLTLYAGHLFTSIDDHGNSLKPRGCSFSSLGKVASNEYGALT